MVKINTWLMPCIVFVCMEGKVSNIVHDYIEDYIRGLLPERNGIIKEMEDYASLNNVPIIHPEAARFLSFLIKCKGVKNILEVGTAIGYSAIVMHQAAGECRIVTIERDQSMIEEARKNISSAGLESSISIVEGEADEILKNMDDKFDLIFLDAAKGQYLEFFPDCDRMLQNGGIIFADNVLFRGMVATNALLIRRKITIVKRMRKYLSFMSENPGYDTSVLPLGDGVAVSLKLGG
jgi:caffeoyl-CoA O-methyltransferase